MSPARPAEGAHSLAEGQGRRPIGAPLSATGLRLTLLDGHRTLAFEGVTSLVAADASGQFGIQPGHAGFITVLEPGLFRFQRGTAAGWTYAAGLGGLLACDASAGATEVRIVSGRFLFGEQPEALQSNLDALLDREHALLLSTRESQMRLDLALVKRLQLLAETAA